MNLTVLAIVSSIALAAAFPERLQGDDHGDNGGQFKQTSGIEATHEDEFNNDKAGSHLDGIKRLFSLWGKDSEESNEESLSEEDGDEDGSEPHSFESQKTGVLDGRLQGIHLDMAKATQLQRNQDHQEFPPFKRLPIPISHKVTSGMDAMHEDESNKGKVRSNPGEVDRFFHLWGKNSEESSGQSLSEEDDHADGVDPYFQEPQKTGLFGGGHHWHHHLHSAKAAPLPQTHNHHVVHFFRRHPFHMQHAYAMEVIRHVPIPVPHPLPYPVPRPYPVYIHRPYPVTVPKPVPYTIERRVPYPVYVHHRVPVPHPYHVHVPRWVPYYVHVPVGVQVPGLEKVPAFAHFSGGEGQGRNEGGSEGENEKGKGADHGDERH